MVGGVYVYFAYEQYHRCRMSMAVSLTLRTVIVKLFAHEAHSWAPIAGRSEYMMIPAWSVLDLKVQWPIALRFAVVSF